MLIKERLRILLRSFVIRRRKGRGWFSVFIKVSTLALASIKLLEKSLDANGRNGRKYRIKCGDNYAFSYLVISRYEANKNFALHYKWCLHPKNASKKQQLKNINSMSFWSSLKKESIFRESTIYRNILNFKNLICWIKLFIVMNFESWTSVSESQIFDCVLTYKKIIIEVSITLYFDELIYNEHIL